SYKHPDFTKIEPWDVRAEIKKTQDEVKKAAGVEPKLLRPPYGRCATPAPAPVPSRTGRSPDPAWPAPPPPPSPPPTRPARRSRHDRRAATPATHAGSGR
ncbi:hypothetical protein ETD86_53890, partial [Nonomuraea turkmeniaca]